MKRLTLPGGPLASRSRTAPAPRQRLGKKAAAAAVGFVLVLGTGGAAGAESPTAGNELSKKIDKILSDERLAGAGTSVVVSDAADGDVLYERHSGKRMMPASNTKLLTAAAALGVLGPGYRYRTDVLAHGDRSGGRLDGDLYLRGTGDPTLLAEDYDALAADVAASGIKEVTGRLVADDTRFDSQRLGRSWAADDESAYYSSQISALSVAPDTDYDTGSVRLEVAPGSAPGKKPKVKMVPGNDYVDVEVTAETVAEDGDSTLSVDREHGGNTLTVSGGIPAGADPEESWTSVWEPTGYAASVFAGALKDHGVRVAGKTETGKATPDGARRVARHKSMPVSELNVPFLKLSNNNHAEVLTKTMGYEAGGEGTWEEGLKAVQGFLKKEGVDTGTLRQVDGSGLSRMNNVPAAEFGALLRAVRDKPWFGKFHDALPVACAPGRMKGGTLRTRMCGTPAELNAHAKTGSLTGASGLSGYVDDAGGRRLVFSIVLNNYLAESVKDIEDEIVVALAESGDGASGKAADGKRDGTSQKPKSAATQPSGRDAADPDGSGGLECSWRKPVRC
ncbi:D-alanyl-D-alanine carboxypeptidase / D-alanyl-D-alanine-endopeptidase (penicillin-binding protein 4) [Streptomyces sp. WMMB 714]|uniref:D-alanyl-D-alanine carboxypeptidase/D-alanyl-D-alanine endopeptidase n=1 Tax=Streptomyces sp. WMMB 714 TaxID=1286822 RepID=UPI0008237C12|nr:D-alanyl-D-alanine carboxypeptidase/D-alanyl-D-alanine-endopeptidase [Streptomyces sp. WMMB 714]SCK58434.1 D-alanyl-D-alanine carboxypeptidase / D-alanyl-D-alanine-endopeptidase (penicillin-binding protein 4) [Streptomyces sp. WMMB 714]